MADNLETMEHGLKNVANYSSKFDTSMGHAEVSIGKIITSFIGADLAKRMYHFVVAQSAVLTSVTNGLSGLKASATDMVIKQKTLNSDLRELNAHALERIANQKTTQVLVDRERFLLQDQLRITRAQLNAKEAMQRFHPVELFTASVLLKSATELYHTHTMLSASIIEANSNMDTRISLTRDVLRVQQQLGTEFGITSEAARALIHYGYDLEATFESSLKLVTQMHEGIGLSVSQGAELVAVYDRQLKAPVREIADALTRVVNDTALAADNAARMAINIGRAVAALRPGMNKDLAGVNELIGRYEGSLQKLGGQFGQFQELLTKMTTPEGAMQAGILGVNDPGFLASKEATKRVVDSFAQYAKNFLGNADGWNRALRLQSLSEMFGTSAQQINLMVAAVADSNEQRATTLSLEERYREQIRASATSFTRLGHSLSALLQEGVLPLLKPVTLLIGGLASMAEGLISVPGAAYAVTAAFGIGAAFMAQKAWSAVEAFGVLTLTLRASALAAKERALAEAGGVAGPAASGMRSLLPLALRGAAVSFGAVLLAGLAGFGLGTALNALYHAATKYIRTGGTTFQNTQLKQAYGDSLNMTLRHLASRGDADGIRTAVDRARAYWLKEGKRSPADIERDLAVKTRGLDSIAGNVKSAIYAGGSTIDQSDVEARADEVDRGQAEMIKITNELRDSSLKMQELEKEKMRLDTAKHAEEVRTHRLNLFQRIGDAISHSAYFGQ